MGIHIRELSQNIIKIMITELLHKIFPFKSALEGIEIQ